MLVQAQDAMQAATAKTENMRAQIEQPEKQFDKVIKDWQSKGDKLDAADIMPKMQELRNNLRPVMETTRYF